MHGKKEKGVNICRVFLMKRAISEKSRPRRLGCVRHVNNGGGSLRWVIKELERDGGMARSLLS